MFIKKNRLFHWHLCFTNTSCNDDFMVCKCFQSSPPFLFHLVRKLGTKSIVWIKFDCSLTTELFSVGLPMGFDLYQMTKFLSGPNLQTLTDNKFEVAKVMVSVYEREENIVGKGENPGDQYFLFFSQSFQKPSQSVLKFWIVC